MEASKKYLLEVNAVGTFEELDNHLKMLYRQFNELNIQIALEENSRLHETTVMTADIKEIAK